MALRVSLPSWRHRQRNPSRSSRLPRHCSASGSWRHRRCDPLRSSHLPRHRSASGSGRKVSLEFSLQFDK
uniref:Uncharacterized protein n=1 Tax=Zea mays TaxID=4577 RepID=B6SRU4_MAIZE|nr:hypothetical protein [Zea mays]ACG27763.1 hypothetical protein [Zea mays]